MLPCRRQVQKKRNAIKTWRIQRLRYGDEERTKRTTEVKMKMIPSALAKSIEARPIPLESGLENMSFVSATLVLLSGSCVCFSD